MDSFPMEVAMGDKGGFRNRADTIAYREFGKAILPYIVPSAEALRKYYQDFWPAAEAIYHLGSRVVVELPEVSTEEHRERLRNLPILGDWPADLRFLNGSFEERNELFIIDSDTAYKSRERVVMVGRRLVKVKAGPTDGLALVDQGIFYSGNNIGEPQLV